jgi:hypothetical protein
MVISSILAPGRGDVSVERVDSRQHLLQQECVAGGEETGERLLQRGDLAAHRCPRHLGQHLGVALAGDQRGQHLPAGDPEDVRGDHAQLDLGVFQQLLRPLLLRGAHRHQVSAVAGDITQPPDLRRGTKLGRISCRSATLHNQTASSLPVLGRPGRCFTSLAFTSHVSNPCASSRQDTGFR